jgi:hypothetical protein
MNAAQAAVMNCEQLNTIIFLNSRPAVKPKGAFRQKDGAETRKTKRPARKKINFLKSVDNFGPRWYIKTVVSTQA